MRKGNLTVVIPCYNEEEILETTIASITTKIKQLIEQEKILPKSDLLLVDDGSKDKTWHIIQEYHQKFPSLIKGIKLSKNAGHQNALLSGLNSVTHDISISIDADLQDDICAIDKMIDAYNEGYDIVYGVRENRSSDSFLKKNTALQYYRLMGVMGVEQIANHADFRLLARQPLNALSYFGEKNLYLRGIIPLLGFPSTKVFYSRLPRLAGESKYPLRKMLSFAWQGITSFSVMPLRVISILGGLIFIASIFILLWLIITKLSGDTVAGWSSLMFSIFFFCGVQLLSLGIIGEYIGKIYFETKSRPRFIIETALDLDAKNDEITGK